MRNGNEKGRVSEDSSHKTKKKRNKAFHDRLTFIWSGKILQKLNHNISKANSASQSKIQKKKKRKRISADVRTSKWMSTRLLTHLFASMIAHVWANFYFLIFCDFLFYFERKNWCLFICLFVFFFFICSFVCFLFRFFFCSFVSYSISHRGLLCYT